MARCDASQRAISLQKSAKSLAEFAPAGAKEQIIFLGGIHFCPKILLSPQVSKSTAEARCDASQRAIVMVRKLYAPSPSGMMQVISVRLEQAFQEDQGQPSEATGPGLMYTGLPVAS